MSTIAPLLAELLIAMNVKRLKRRSILYNQSRNPHTHTTGKQMHAMGLSIRPWGHLTKDDSGPSRGIAYVSFVEGSGPNVP